MRRRLRSEAGTPIVQDGVPVWERDMNAEQLAVIRHERGPLQNLAQAGSGKTRALVHRVARLVHQVGVEPSRILCVTFSRAGAKEMNARLAQLGISGVGSTWHAFCGRVLREDRTEWATWEVDEKNRAKRLIKEAAGYKHVNWTGADATKLTNFIGRCKANLFEPMSEEAGALARKIFSGSWSRALQVFEVSQRLVEEQRLLTFDDMLVFGARHLRSSEDVRAAWAARFDHVMVDEAQDNNFAQKTLQELVARDNRNLMVVGDLAQAIFSFRGSTPDYLAAFASDWPDFVRVAMCRNYRSARAIVKVANDVIRAAKVRQPEDMIAERDVEGEVRIVEADTLDDEARELATFAKAHVQGGGRLADMCVLYRLGAQSRAVEEALIREQLPYFIVGGVNFYERKEVKDLLAYLRLGAGRDKEGDAVRRSINAPFRFLGAAFVDKVEYERGGDPKAPPESWVMKAAARDRVQDRQKASAHEWVRILEIVRAAIRGKPEDGWQVATDLANAISQSSSGEGGYLKPCECGRPADYARIGAKATGEVALRLEGKCAACVPRVEGTPAEVLEQIVRATRYIEWLEKEEGEESIETSHAANVRELLRVSRQFKTIGQLLDYVEIQVAEGARNQRRKDERNVLTLMTIHRSKGLEWPIVWVVGMNDGVLPHYKGDPEEERRLAYVACTRARDTLVVSYVHEMAMRSGVREVLPSPYLDAFPGFVGEEEPAPETPPVIMVTAENAVEAARKVRAEIDARAGSTELEPGLQHLQPAETVDVRDPDPKIEARSVREWQDDVGAPRPPMPGYMRGDCGECGHTLSQCSCW